MTSEILDINESVIVDDSIESYQFVEQLPEAGEANMLIQDKCRNCRN